MSNAMSDRSWDRMLPLLGVKPDKRGKFPVKLTEEIIERVRISDIDFDFRLRDGDVPGLALHVGASGATSWWLRYRAQDGKAYMFRVGNGDQFNVAKARAAAADVLADVRKGKNPAAKKVEVRQEIKIAKASALTMREFIEGIYWDRWLSTRKSGIKDKMRLLAAWPELIDQPLRSITSEDIETVFRDRMKGHLEPGTILRDWSGFRRMLGKAFEWKKILVMPVAGRPKALEDVKGNERIRHVGSRDPQERERFLKALVRRETIMDDPKARPEKRRGARMIAFAARLAWATGMRRGEILGLRVTEVGVDAITLPAYRTKTNKARAVILNDAARAALKIWPPDEKTGEYFVGYLDDRGWIIPADKGGATSRWRTRLDVGWKALCAEAGIDSKDLHLHDLRHSFATDLRRAKVQLEVVAKALGHADVKSTMRYAHVGDDEVADAVAKIRI